MRKQTFTVSGRTAAFYPAQQDGQPLIVLNTYTDHGDAVMQHLHEMHCPEFNLLTVSGLQWNSDMTPWECPPLNPKDAPFPGGADGYLDLLCTEIIPRALAMTAGKPAFTGIAGYSLAGLFALYALTRSPLFDRAASMSGSLWYPRFREYVLSHPMQNRPDRLFLSLGDAEARTRHPLLKTVQENTEAIAAHYRSLGVDTVYTLNAGNHFREPELRTAKGILALLQPDSRKGSEEA